MPNRTRYLFRLAGITHPCARQELKRTGRKVGEEDDRDDIVMTARDFGGGRVSGFPCEARAAASGEGSWEVNESGADRQ